MPAVLTRMGPLRLRSLANGVDAAAADLGKGNTPIAHHRSTFPVRFAKRRLHHPRVRHFEADRIKPKVPQALPKYVIGTRFSDGVIPW